MFASFDWMPTLAELAGGPKGDGLKKQIEEGAYQGFVKTTLDGINQVDYLTGKSQKSARESFSTLGRHPVGAPLQELEDRTIR